MFGLAVAKAGDAREFVSVMFPLMIYCIAENVANWI